MASARTWPGVKPGEEARSPFLPPSLPGLVGAAAAAGVVLAVAGAIALLAYRVIGVVPFEAIGARVLLFVFPKLFENWWLYCVIVMKWKPSLVPRSWLTTIVPLLALLVPKMAPLEAWKWLATAWP